ncbi:MAG: hypothetical protein ABH810_01590 [bacterium]
MDTSVIKERIAIIEKLEDENKKAKELLRSTLENDKIYPQIAEEAKSATKKRKELKDAIYSQEGNAKLTEDVRENMDEIKTLREILAVELMDFHEKNKTDEFVDSTGEKRKFVFTVKLLPKGAKEDDRDDLGRYTPTKNE